MIFRAKPTIDSDDLEWQLNAWEWLLKNLGGVNALKSFPTLIPSKSDFMPSGKKGMEHANFVFDQVCGRMNIDPNMFELLQQQEAFEAVIGDTMVIQNAPIDALGTYSTNQDSNKHRISFSPKLLKNLEHLIATFVHELCHPILLAIPEAPPGEAIENDLEVDVIEELTTDLATVFFGFGIYNGNASMSIEQFSDSASGMQGWSATGGGYLSQNMWGFALALRTILTGEDDANIIKYSKMGLKANYQKNLKYLSKNQSLIAMLEKI